MRVCFQDEQIYVGSRSLWKADTGKNDFWNSYYWANLVSDNQEGLEKLVRNFPFCVFGESYGNVPSFKYDCEHGERKFRVFDILDMSTNKWLNPQAMIDICENFKIPCVPLLYHGPFSFEKVLELAEGKSALNNKHVREGVVVSPAQDRNTDRGQRVKLKCVGLGYFEAK